jgi:hypothetical protein
LVQLWLRALKLVGYRFPGKSRVDVDIPKMSSEQLRFLTIGKTMKDLSRDYMDRLYNHSTYLESTCVLNNAGLFKIEEKHRKTERKTDTTCLESTSAF